MRPGLGFVLFLFGSALSAAPLSCVPGTLQDYFDLGSDGCLLSDKVVSGFTPLSIPTSATAIVPTRIFVTPDFTPFSPALTFSGTLTAPASAFLDIRFSYLVRSPLPIIGLSAALDGVTVSGDGAITVIKEHCDGEFSAGDCTGTPGIPLIVFAIDGDAELLASTAYDPPLFLLGVADDIGIDGGLDGEASFGSVTNRFFEASPVPEPSTAVSLVLGAILFYRLRRKRSL